MSMACPKCGHDSVCKDSRRGANHTTTRRYGCLKCPAYWSTLEELVRLDKRKRKIGGRGPKNHIDGLRETRLAEVKKELSEEIKEVLGL